MRLRYLTLLLFAAACATSTAFAAAQPRLKLATTTSTYDSGLLDILLPPFEQKQDGGIRVDVIAVGTGKALKLAENGDVDAVLVHAPRLEEEFVAAGFGVDRRGVMHNDFIVVGPLSDQAGIAGTDKVADAFATIARKKAMFFSRGDLSGTHRKEQAIWAIAGIEPGGTWYIEVGQGMAATLRMADEKRGYVLIDRGTYLALRETVNLRVLVEYDPPLHNPYSIIAVNPRRWPHVEYGQARALIDYVTSAEAQALIGGYRKYGQQLFAPSALDHEAGGQDANDRRTDTEGSGADSEGRQ